FKRLPTPSGEGKDSMTSSVRPRTSKGITDLLRSRSLTELTRQITPPTKNGHAPPPIESRKSPQSVNPNYVWT
ncbi:10008_t:CDS:2, partial [Acaulospora morrowiae]